MGFSLHLPSLYTSSRPEPLEGRNRPSHELKQHLTQVFNRMDQPDFRAGAARTDTASAADQQAHAAFMQLKQVANELIIGQERLMERLLIALLSNGHLLVEGAPGLA